MHTVGGRRTSRRNPGDKLHVLTHLIVVLRPGTSELEVDDNPLAAVGHHAVGTSLHHLTVVTDAEDGTLVVERPSPREPVGHAGMLQTLSQHRGDALQGKAVVVEHALAL